MILTNNKKSRGSYSGYSDQSAVIAEALKQYIQMRKQQEIIELFGTIEYEEDYDYQQQRFKKISYN
ncbi:MAG: hypothetical protein EAZ76_02845 [Nostocales cyanobacterium]|nr:MAG: hypothetical protein EAZ87_01160 [Nostocales cyanobacterium]TAF19763.1 MAG: hypothetical protein EAZ76_02845 [Nostocales cyanobacterium]